MTTRAGFVAILGPPNAGKSTLLNRLVGAKVSIVSPKIQTTRRRITGITIHEASQIMFVDTPGIFAPSRKLEKAMVQTAWSGVDDADVVICVVDAKRKIDRNTAIALDGLKGTKTIKYLAVNKIDLVHKPDLLSLVGTLNQRLVFEATYLVSAITGDGCSALIETVAAALPEGPWLFPEDQLSDLSQRALAAEITREKLFLKLHQELPYNVTVETEGWAEAPGGQEVRIDQTIYVMRDSQKAIVLGQQGRMIKSIGAVARQELEELLEARVHLFLYVKVRPDWMNDPERYEALGLTYPQ